MSNFSKTLHDYRQGEWKDNFKNINYPNVEAAIRKILTTQEPAKHYDRHGNLQYSDKLAPTPLTLDEQIFRLCVLMDTQTFDDSNVHCVACGQPIKELRGQDK